MYLNSHGQPFLRPPPLAQAQGSLSPSSCMELSPSAPNSPAQRPRAPSMNLDEIPACDVFSDAGASCRSGLSAAHLSSSWRIAPPCEGQGSCCNSGHHCTPRLIARDSSFKQSCGRMNIRRLSRSQSTWWLRKKDVFHTLVNMSTWKCLLIASSVIVSSWVLFAGLFFASARQCNLSSEKGKDLTFIQALYLAIETIETIGYGVPDSYFNSCHVGLFILGASALWESFLNAVLIGVFFTRLSRGTARAGAVLFSEKAIIKEIDGKCHFMFQVCDIRKHQLCEAHVRLYCIQHAEASSGIVYQTRAMRLQHPDDELGAMLLLALPQVVVHRVDPCSPLCPQLNRCCSGSTPATGFRYPDVLQRACDEEAGNRDGMPRARAGCSATATACSSSAMASVGAIVQQQRPVEPDLRDVAAYIARGELEVLCVVEGIDPSTSNTLQVRHSYTRDDIVFNASFQRCVSRGADGFCEVDFDAFHELTELKYDEDFVQSIP